VANSSADFISDHGHKQQCCTLIMDTTSSAEPYLEAKHDQSMTGNGAEVPVRYDARA
jgi:hypothetical protein